MVGPVISETRFPSGIAFIYLPNDVDRETYIANCMRTSSVSIITPDGQYLHKVRIGKIIKQFLDFPESTKQLGSPVLWINVPIHNYPIVTDVLEFDDDMLEVQEQHFRFRREGENAVVEIAGRGKKGQLFINAESEESEGGEVFVNIRNASKKGKLKINVEGDVEIDVDGQSRSTHTDIYSITQLDDEGNPYQRIVQTKEKTFFHSEDINLGSEEANEPAILGDKAEGAYNEIKSALTNINNNLKSIATAMTAAAGNPSPVFGQLGWTGVASAVTNASTTLTADIKKIESAVSKVKSKIVKLN